MTLAYGKAACRMFGVISVRQRCALGLAAAAFLLSQNAFCAAVVLSSSFFVWPLNTRGHVSVLLQDGVQASCCCVSAVALSGCRTQPW